MGNAIVLLCMLLSLGLTLTSCGSEGAADHKKEIVRESGAISAVWGKTLPIPQSWEDIAAVKVPEGVMFRLHEKTAYETDRTGLVFAILAQSHEDFADLHEHFLEDEGVTCIRPVLLRRAML